MGGKWRIHQLKTIVPVLCPMNRGEAGARSLKIELQAALNAAGERKVERRWSRICRPAWWPH
jgi:hypothetical protein